MNKNFSFPILVNKDQDWVFVANCPIFKWFATQWSNLELLKNNLQDISDLYISEIKDWDDDIYDTKFFINLNFNQNGKITNNFSKEIDQNFRKRLIHS